MPTHLHRTLICLSILFAGATSAFAQPRVVATIAPLHSLAALVMEGAGVPQLLLKGTESPHSYSLRPSQTRMLSSADVVIRIDASFEVFMNKPLRALAGRALVIDLLKVPGMKLLSVQDDHENGALTPVVDGEDITDPTLFTDNGLTGDSADATPDDGVIDTLGAGDVAVFTYVHTVTQTEVDNQ